MTGGRFRLGLGVSHEPVTRRLGVATGKPLTDMRAYVEALRANEQGLRSAAADLPRHAPRQDARPRGRDRRRSDLGQRLAERTCPPRWPGSRPTRRDSFFLANMIPTVIDDDRDAARAINRRTLSGYVSLPNYRNYWKQAGYEEEMDGIEAALAEGRRDDVPGADERPLARRLHLVGLGHPGARRHRGVAGHGRAADRGDVVDQRRPAEGHPGALRRRTAESSSAQMRCRQRSRSFGRLLVADAPQSVLPLAGGALRRPHTASLAGSGAGWSVRLIARDAATVDDVLHGRRRRRAGCSWAPEVDVESSARQARSVGRSRCGLADAIVTTGRDDVMGHATHGVLRFARRKEATCPDDDKRRKLVNTSSREARDPNRHSRPCSRRCCHEPDPARRRCREPGGRSRPTRRAAARARPAVIPAPPPPPLAPTGPSLRRGRGRRARRGRDAAVRGGRGQRRPGRRARLDAVELGRRHRPRSCPRSVGWSSTPTTPRWRSRPVSPSSTSSGPVTWPAMTTRSAASRPRPASTSPRSCGTSSCGRSSWRCSPARWPARCSLAGAGATWPSAPRQAWSPSVGCRPPPGSASTPMPSRRPASKVRWSGRPRSSRP